MSNTTLTEQQLEARRAYHRKWRAEHPDKVQEYQQRWLDKLVQEQEEQEEQDVGKDDAYDG